MTMRKTAATGGLLAALLANAAFAAEGRIPTRVPHLDHVFLIMMENHGYSQIVDNPFAPYINVLARSANVAANYFAVAHPSLTNYLEVVGGSNFGVHTDNAPDWGNTTCVTNLASGIVATDNPPSPKVCPIAGSGTDAATPAIDMTNETQGPPGENNLDGVRSIPAAANTSGKTIGDQLAAARLSWKSYQESLPFTGAANVTYSDGILTDNTDFSALGLSSSDFVLLYAAKHNPFVYFKSVQQGSPNNSLANVVGFDGPQGLYADLRTGRVPAFSFIVPNQCNDQHGRGNAGATCAFDPNDNGTQNGLNQALIYRGDVTVQAIVTAIKSSSVWTKGGDNAIIVMWDENDYSVSPSINQVLVIVDTSYGVHGVTSSVLYNHFSLLKTLEAGFGLPCLNHACDDDVEVMSDLFVRN
jgi:phosphatidylinositol-3-phosphatase